MPVLIYSLLILNLLFCDRVVVANKFLSGYGANSGNLLIPLSPTLRGSQMMMVVEWGASVGSTAYGNKVGVPTDLDVYLKFAVSATEDCLGKYISQLSSIFAQTNLLPRSVLQLAVLWVCQSARLRLHQRSHH